nr:pyruvate kinase-like [Maniola hyperantus]
MSDKKPEDINFTDVDFSTPDILKSSSYRYRRCPVFVTLTDSEISAVDIQKMLEAGMNIARFTMSSSTRGDKMRLLGKINKASLVCCEKYDVNSWPVATCITLKTCIVKTGLLENDKDFITLENKTELILFHNISHFNKCNENNIFVDYPLISDDVKVGTEISIAADEIILKCISVVDETSIKCVVTKGGKLTSMNDLCVRNTKRSGPLVTEKDFEMVKFALKNQIDAIFICYARHPDTIKIIKKYIASKKVRRPIILAGISSEECLENIDDIIKESDGIILSRLLLPYEVESSLQYRMPQIQKWIAGKCLQAGKSLYIYGVFDNALRTGFFTNNEISDVTNAIMDGVSGFMLAKCSSPDNIIEVLNGINKLCYTVEPLVTSKINFRRIIDEVKMPINAAEATAISCVTVANQTNARVIIIPTVSGRTLRSLQLMRPSSLIIAVSSNIQVTRHLISYRGVFPLLYNGLQHNNWYLSLEDRISFALEYAVKRSWLVYGDTYITLQRGSDTSSFCDSLSIWKVSIMKKSLVECPENYQDDYLL